jgi:hypothetical protein
MTYGFNPSKGLIIFSVRLFGPAGDMIVRLALDTEATSTLFFFEPRRGTPGAMLRDRITIRVRASGVRLNSSFPVWTAKS